MRYIILSADRSARWNTMHEATEARHMPRFRVMFIFPQDEMLTTAASLAYVQGTSATDAAPEAARAVSQWFDVANEENAPIVQDAIDLAMSEVEDALSAIMAGRLGEERSEYVEGHPCKEHVCEFLMAANTPDATIGHLQRAIRQYLIESVLSRWAALTRPDALAYWTAQAAAHLEDVRDSGRRCMACPKTVRKWPVW